MSWFRRSITAPDDLRRLQLVEERTESIVRRMESLMIELEEFYAKVNKARQRVVKEDRDAARVHVPDISQMSPAEQKELLRRRIRGL